MPGHCISWYRLGRAGQAEENEHRLVQAQDVLDIQASDARPELLLGDRGELVDHEATGGMQSVALVRLDRDPEKRGLRRIRREGAEGDGAGRVEVGVLNDGGGPGLPA